MKKQKHNAQRRDFLRITARTAGAAALLASLPPSIRQALAIPAARITGTIQDVEHVVILMQENRSFDHYFGTLRGVRGFGDRHPLPMAGNKLIWQQSDGVKDVPPYHLDTKTTSAQRTPGTPHSFADAQAAWNQGKFGFWPKFKTEYSMGHYCREDIPFQFALAESFTLCDAYHCSITTGTDPNRIVFWSGSNFNPELRARGENCTDADSEPDNLRCWIKGELPEPGYTYAGSAFQWPTIPDVLQKAGISWRIYQDPNNNWTGAMHGGLAFESFRTAKAGSPLYREGMSDWSLVQFAEDVKNGTLPQVSWILPPATWSEHPSPSSPIQGAEFTARILNALTANPEIWSKTVFILTFDENDGLFDHVPPPALPSYNSDGTLAGKSTIDLHGQYFSDPERKHLEASDTISGAVRPWGLGPRVPMYVISPWSKGGWVNSQVFDHTSVGQFLEKRFGIVIPAVSPWHRAICGDLTSALDFVSPNDPLFPALPDVSHASGVVLEAIQKPKPHPPATPERLFQEPGTRPSRALPYELSVVARSDSASGNLSLAFANTGKMGAVFHVYDKRHLERIPRRYTVESGKQISDDWTTDEGSYDLWVYGPNCFLREFREQLSPGKRGAQLEIEVTYDLEGRAIIMTVRNSSDANADLLVRANAYRTDGPWKFSVAPGKELRHTWSLVESIQWYDFTASSETFERRFAGRLETGRHGISDPKL
jgi:phospholipase C